MCMKILVTGGKGLLGTHLAAALAGFADVVVASHSDTAGSAALAIDNQAQVDAALDNGDFSHVVNCAAIRDPEECMKDPARAYLVNAVAVEYIAQACRRNNIKLVQISTDYVFPGTTPPYRETCDTLPVNVYGRTKLAGEFAARATPNFIVARIPALWDSDPENPRSPLYSFVQKFRAGKPFPVENRWVRHYTLAGDIAKALAFCIEKNMLGIIHLSASESQSKADFARDIGKFFGYDPELVINAAPPEQADVRPPNSALDASFYRAHNGPYIRGVSEVFHDLR